ncbi:MAG TPA: hypothetical protein VE397_08455, partial [Stellaceae bacterium]|nr:hypothetical protein [Stellaceae bacterium]
MSLMDERRAAVEEALDRVRRIVGDREVTRATLDAIKPVLIELAARRALFPPEHFPFAPDGRPRVYRLAED